MAKLFRGEVKFWFFFFENVKYRKLMCVKLLFRCKFPKRSPGHILTPFLAEVDYCSREIEPPTRQFCTLRAMHMHLEAASVQPAQMPMGRIPHVLKEKFEAKLQQMCTDGIIKKVTELSEWINPMLAIDRANRRKSTN